MLHMYFVYKYCPYNAIHLPILPGYVLLYTGLYLDHHDATPQSGSENSTGKIMCALVYPAWLASMQLWLCCCREWLQNELHM